MNQVDQKRNELIEEASEQARKMGANTITGVRIETTFSLSDSDYGQSQFGNVAFYGTAMAVKR